MPELSNPRKYTNPIKVTGPNIKKHIALWKAMSRIRLVEDTIAKGVEQKLIGCPCHLSTGQEAVAVGVAQALTKTDRVFGNHRSHAHFLALGGSPFEIFSEVLGRSPGCSGGFGGSMHLIDPANGFMGSLPIVGATIPLAVGAALAAKKDLSDTVAVVFFGDGATEEGIFHESLNYASLLRLPVLFICENNLFSSHLHISKRQPHHSTIRFAESHRIFSKRIDGNDVAVVSKTTSTLVNRLRNGGGPAYIEAVTYRHLGHVGHRADLDVGLRRSKDLQLWKARDPINRLELGLLKASKSNAVTINRITRKLKLEISTAWERAEKAPFPQTKDLMNHVYAPGQAKGMSN